jgi:hypothetical protein
MNLINWLGVGTVAATKQTNTKEIMVHLPKNSPMADGRTVAQVEAKEETAVNANGEPVKVNTMISNVRPAKWNAFGEPNRLTAPDVKEGSQVSLYQVSGQSTIYWTTNGFSGETHRLETIVWGFQANPNLDENTEFNVDNFYTITLDTRSGFMAYRSSQSNGEKSGFEVKLDGGQGRLEAVGTGGSSIVMDDFNSKFIYTNKEETLIGVDKKKVIIDAPDSILFNGDESVSIKTKVFTLQCEDINVQAKTAKVAIGTTEWEGEVNLKGNLNHTGNTKQTGNTVSTGVVQGLTGVRTSIVDLDMHGHIGVENGDGVSGNPMPTPQPPVG